MQAARSIRAVLTTILLAGCNAILGVGDNYHVVSKQGCTLNSECTGGFKCLFATCSEPCAADQDCLDNQRCLETDTLAGTACVSSSQAACTGSSECPKGTTCSSTGCRKGCASNAECLSDQTCKSGECVGTSGHDPAGRDAGTPEASSGGNQGSGGGGGTPGGGSGGRDASAEASGSGGLNAGGAGGDSGVGGETGAPPECVKDNDPCATADQSGLCRSGTCSACVDVTDDARCATAYGANHLCLQGNCVAGNCRSSSDCTNTICINNTCTPCKKDGDCSDSTTVCNLSTGSCVSEISACTGKVAGAACAGTGSKHLCCGATLVCQAIDCCTDAQCPVGQKCSAGTCASVSCPAVSGQGPYYVDATDPGTNGRTGDTTCPFKSILQALAFVTNPNNPQNKGFNVTITVRSAISEATEGTGAFPIYVGSRILIAGAPSQPIITVPDGKTGFIFNYEKPVGSQAFGGISNLTITQTTAVVDSTKTGYGIEVVGTHPDATQAIQPTTQGIKIDHVTVQKFWGGIRVTAGGYADLGPVITATGNYRGVSVNSGYVYIGHTAPSDAQSHFDKNVHTGIYVGGASIMHVDGSDLGATGTPLTANSNNYGIRWQSLGTIPAGLSNLIQAVQINGNSGVDPSTSLTNGAGLFAYAGGNTVAGAPGNVMKIRSSLFTNNQQAVHIAPDSGAANPNHLQNFDFGANGTTDPGKNTFSGASTLLCLDTNTTVQFEDVNGPLKIAGNTWGTNACTGTAPSYKLTSVTNCSSKADVGFELGVINKNAALINATCGFR